MARLGEGVNLTQVPCFVIKDDKKCHPVLKFWSLGLEIVKHNNGIFKDEIGLLFALCSLCVGKTHVD